MRRAAVVTQGRGRAHQVGEDIRVRAVPPLRTDRATARVARCILDEAGADVRNGAEGGVPSLDVSDADKIEAGEYAPRRGCGEGFLPRVGMPAASRPATSAWVPVGWPRWRSRLKEPGREVPGPGRPRSPRPPVPAGAGRGAGPCGRVRTAARGGVPASTLLVAVVSRRPADAAVRALDEGEEPRDLADVREVLASKFHGDAQRAPGRTVPGMRA